MPDDRPARIPEHNRAEEAILNHIASFRRQYNSLYQRGPVLLLTSQNEYYCTKSIISFVVPSLVPFEDLLNLHSAAQVLADLITYVPPSGTSPAMPRQLCSPAIVVENQKGGGAELALVLASVLLGAGYCAFVVQGDALKTLVSADTSTRKCPYLSAKEKEAAAQEEVAPSKYSVRPPPDMRSKYSLIMEERARRRQALEDEKKTKKKKKSVKKLDSDHSDLDLDSGSMLHFWVLVLPPNRGITRPTFVEPTTGQVIPLAPSNNHNYNFIHALFNHKNYWACIKYNHPISEDMFDLSDHDIWMTLMEDNSPRPLKASATELPAENQETTQDDMTQPGEPVQQQNQSTDASAKDVPGGGLLFHGTRRRGKESLKIPKSWARPIIIKEEALRLRFPGGWREEVYKGAIVRRYSPFTHQRGAILVLTLNGRSDSATEVREEFQQRQDDLLTRVSNLKTGAVVETFAKSRKDTLKCHEYWRSPSSLADRAKVDGMNNPSSASKFENHKNDSTDVCRGERFWFHSKFRVDALRCRIIGDTKWREEFDERSDLLLARTVHFVSSDPTPPRAIQVIEEEFACPKDVEPHTAVQKRVFQIAEGRILLVYNYGKHRLLQPSRFTESHLGHLIIPNRAKYRKHGFFGKRKYTADLESKFGWSFIKPNDTHITTLTPDMTHGFQPDPSVEEVPLPQLWNILQAEMEAEAKVGEEVRKGVEETAAIRAARINEERNTVLFPDIFDIDKNETVQYILQQRNYQEAHREETEKKKKEEREGRVDTIAPYLSLLLGDDADMGPSMVRERCLQDMRDRLALRANLLQDRLDQAKAYVLECREEVSRRKRAGAEERAALVAKASAAEASHRRLRAQLVAWKHEASERYETLSAQLDANLKFGPRRSTMASISASSVSEDQ